MTRSGLALAAALAWLVSSCSGEVVAHRDGGGDGATTDGGPVTYRPDSGPAPDAPAGGDGPADDGSAGTDAGHDAAGPDAGHDAAGEVTAADLLALTSSCAQLAGSSDFATDQGQPYTVPICTLAGAVWWRADMDIDCDGGQSQACKADPWYQAETSATDSQGNYLDASTLPYVVVPLPSRGFDYAAAGLELGSVVAVIYNGQLQFGIFGDEGPGGIIGEASYAMAVLFGIDPDPATGGADSGVTYIAFTGSSAVVTKNEDHAEAVNVGRQRAAYVRDNN